MLCLLLAGVAFCTEPATRPDSAGKTTAENAASQVARQPDLVRLGLPAKYAATTFSDSWVTGSAMRAAFGLDTNRGWENGAWYQSGPQQFLSQIFPEASFFRHEDPIRFGSATLVVFKDGRAYTLDQMTDVLSAQGFSFDASELNVMAKVAVLFAYCGRRVTERRDSTPALTVPVPLCAIRSQPRDNRAFPEIEFRSFTVGTKKSGSGEDIPGVWVDCRIDGIPRSVFVWFTRVEKGKHCAPVEVTSPDLVHFYPSPGSGIEGQQGGSHRNE